MKYLSLVAAYCFWGVLPIYWKVLENVTPLTVVSFRILGSLIVLGILCLATGRYSAAVKQFAEPRAFLLSLATGLLSGTNWLLYIVAISNNKTVEAGLGYYILPLVVVLFGRLFFGERLTSWQVIALVFAGAGVVASTAEYGQIPWYALGLALTFALYSTLHKGKVEDPITTMFSEMIVLSPVAIFLLGDGFDSLVNHNSNHDYFLLSLAGIATCAPLILFNSSLKRIPMTAVGFLQYLNPTINLLVAVLIFGEPFSDSQLFAFSLIWIGIAVFLAEKTGLNNLIIPNRRLNRARQPL